MVCQFYGTVSFADAMVSPAGLMALYKIPLDTLQKKPTEFAGVESLMQNWGMWIALTLGIVSAVRRTGNQHTKSLLCFGLMVGQAINVAVSLAKTNAMCAALNVPESGVYFNIAVSVVLMGLSYRGWDKTGKAMIKTELLVEAPGKSSASSIAMRYMILLCTFFGLMLVFNMDGIMEGYHFDQSNFSKAYQQWFTLIFTGLGCVHCVCQ